MRPEVSQSSLMFDIVAWLEVNKERLAIGAGVVLAFALLIAVYRWQKTQQELAASRALMELPVEVPGKVNRTPLKSEDLLRVAREYSGTEAGQRALLLGADQLYKEGKFQEAQKEFEGLLRKNPDGEFAPQASFGVAASLDALGKTDEALRRYQEVVTQYPNSGIINQTRMAIARLYEVKNQPELALKSYDELARQKGASSWSAEAHFRREQLLQKHPQLSPSTTNALQGLPPQPSQ